MSLGGTPSRPASQFPRPETFPEAEVAGSLTGPWLSRVRSEEIHGMVELFGGSLSRNQKLVYGGHVLWTEVRLEFRHGLVWLRIDGSG